MGCLSSKLTADGTYEPSSFAMAIAVKQTTDFSAVKFDRVYAGQQKVLVVCTDDGRFEMKNGKVFNSGNHPVELLVPLLHFKAAGFGFEFATATGKPVVVEMWAMPSKDAAVKDLYDELKPLMEKPTALDQVEPTLKGFAGLYIPGGHGAMVNLPLSPALGRLLHAAHKAELPTIADCHGPAALLAAAKVEGAPFCYEGYSVMSFTDATDKMTPKLGYLPGPMPWLQQAALKKAGMLTLSKAEKGLVHVDRELVSGDSVGAAQKLGVLAANMLVEAAAKRG